MFTHSKNKVVVSFLSYVNNVFRRTLYTFAAVDQEFYLVFSFHICAISFVCFFCSLKNVKLMYLVMSFFYFLHPIFFAYSLRFDTKLFVITIVSSLFFSEAYANYHINRDFEYYLGCKSDKSLQRPSIKVTFSSPDFASSF